MYINLHTHRKPQLQDEICVRNAYTCKPEVLENLNYYTSAGIHPWYINDQRHSNYDNLLEALKLPDVISIGECGIDRNRGPALSTQMLYLEQQLTLAEKMEKPVILHIVRAYTDLVPFTKKYKFTGIVHGFNGNFYEAQTLVKHGIRISIGHRMLWERRFAPILKWIPTDFLYLETDNFPINIKTCYEYAMLVRGEEFFQLQRNIVRNFERDFSLVLPT